jgi:hypothetical protein
MQTNSIITPKKLNIDETVITNLKLNKTKQLTAGIINSKTNSAVYIETPYLINPFGLSFYDGGGKDVKEENKSWSLVLKAQGKPEDQEDINNLFNYLKQLDEKAIDFAILNSQTIFKKKYEESQRGILVDLLYNRCVKPSVGPDGTIYPDKISLKIMKNSDMLPDILVFKDSPIPIEISSWDGLQNIIPKGTPIKTIIQPRFYIVNGKCGINARVLQVKIQNVQKIGRPISYAFSENPVENTKEVDTKNIGKESNENVVDSEEEYDSDSEVVDVDN